MAAGWEFNDYTFTATTIAAAKAELTLPMGTLQGTTATFQWTGGVGVSQYWLSVGTTPRGTDLFDQNCGTNLSATVSDLPYNGRSVYVTLWSLLNGQWVFNEYVRVATTLTLEKAELQYPAPGSTLSATKVGLLWSGGTRVSKYWLSVGTTPGGSDILDQDRGIDLTGAVGNLPSDGRKVYVRLWSQMPRGVWEFNDYQYNSTSTGIAKAELTSPPPNSTLTSNAVMLTWTGGTRASQYWLSVGSTAGGSDIANEDRGVNLTATVRNLPADGRGVHVRLWSLIGGNWQFSDYAYTAATASSARAEITTPAPGSTFTASTLLFQWTGGVGVSQYWLSISRSLGGSEIYDHDRGTSLTASVADLPMTGGTLYVRLWSLMNGGWQFKDYEYIATTRTGERAELMVPAPSATLTASTVAFEWTGGAQASRYWLYVGTAPGAFDLFDHDAMTSLSATVAGLPADGRTLYVRLWSQVAGIWQYNDYTYTAPVVEVAPTLCAFESLLGSVDGGQRSSLRFVNDSGGDALVYWLDHQGRRVLSSTLQAGQSYVQNTFATHSWVVTSANGCGVYTPLAGGGQVTIR